VKERWDDQLILVGRKVSIKSKCDQAEPCSQIRMALKMPTKCSLSLLSQISKEALNRWKITIGNHSIMVTANQIHQHKIKCRLLTKIITPVEYLNSILLTSQATQVTMKMMTIICVVRVHWALTVCMRPKTKMNKRKECASKIFRSTRV